MAKLNQATQSICRKTKSPITSHSFGLNHYLQLNSPVATTDKMVGLSQADRIKKAEYLEILDETIRTNPFRKAATALASVMAKHGIESSTCSVLGVPKVPVPDKRCALSKSLQLAQNCNLKLNTLKVDLQTLCSQLSSTTPPPPSPSGESQDGTPDKVAMAGHLLTLIGEAETIAKRIYETTLGLHVAVDFLRQPEDLKLLDFSANGRIQIPNYNFNHASQLCLEWLYSTAFKWLSGFKEEATSEDGLFINIFENFIKAVKDYTAAVCLANQVFRVLLYANDIGKKSLQEYVLSLGHVLKNDMIMEIQSLRRAFDSIQNTFERIGWSASIAWMKYSGKNITVETLNEDGIQVDHSSFQYKFYEGPQKCNKKACQIRKKGKVGKKVPGRDINNNLVISKGASDKSIDAVVANERTDTSGTTGAVKAPPSETLPPKPTQEEIGAATDIPSLRPLHPRRRSRSVSDPSKSPRLAKKKVKGKKSRVSIQKGGDGSVADLLEATPIETNSTGDTTVRRESERSTSKPVGKVSSTTPLLIPAPKIPSALRQQFNAVFGTYPVEKKDSRSGKPMRKKSRSTTDIRKTKNGAKLTAKATGQRV